MSAAAELFPLFLRLAGRRVVVIGGGAVAATRVRQLLDACAQVTVVAPSIVDPIAASVVRCLRRPYETSDLDGAWLAVAAATADVNRQVAREAEARRIFVNAVDDPDAASAYTGGVLRRGDLLVAISTQGRAPALAGLVREALDLLLPSESSVWVERAAELRRGWKTARVPLAGRRPLLLEALNRLYAPREIRT